jgi:hypothetical protein
VQKCCNPNRCSGLAVGVVVARSPVGTANLASVVNFTAACKMTESSGAKSSDAVMTSAETETASESTAVEANSTEAPLVTAAKPAVTTSQRFMVGEH